MAGNATFDIVLVVDGSTAESHRSGVMIRFILDGNHERSDILDPNNVRSQHETADSRVGEGSSPHTSSRAIL